MELREIALHTRLRYQSKYQSNAGKGKEADATGKGISFLKRRDKRGEVGGEGRREVGGGREEDK